MPVENFSKDAPNELAVVIKVHRVTNVLNLGMDSALPNGLYLDKKEAQSTCVGAC